MEVLKLNFTNIVPHLFFSSIPMANQNLLLEQMGQMPMISQTSDMMYDCYLVFFRQVVKYLFCEVFRTKQLLPPHHNIQPKCLYFTEVQHLLVNPDILNLLLGLFITFVSFLFLEEISLCFSCPETKDHTSLIKSKNN